VRPAPPDTQDPKGKPCPDCAHTDHPGQYWGAKGKPCPDCAHTDHPGQYWGAIEAEPCETCEGTAKVLSED